MSKKILIVDDDADLVESLSVFLRAKGYETVSASGGDEGFKRLETDRPDLVLLDMMMNQRGEGFLFSRKMRKDPTFARVPIIMMTGMRHTTGFYFVAGDPRHERFLPVDEFMEKPLDLNRLVARMSELLA